MYTMFKVLIEGIRSPTLSRRHQMYFSFLCIVDTMDNNFSSNVIFFFDINSKIRLTVFSKTYIEIANSGRPNSRRDESSRMVCILLIFRLKLYG